jgi:hypothetical protein
MHIALQEQSVSRLLNDADRKKIASDGAYKTLAAFAEV